MKGAIASLLDRYESPVLGVTLVLCLFGVFINAAGLLHVNGVVQLELMGEALAKRETPTDFTFALTALWWTGLSAWAGWAYLQSYEVDA